MLRVRMTLGYDGTEFYGSQVQPGVRTVQGELERLLRQIAPGSSRTVFAGRTDRGVHAVGQVVSADVRWGRSTDELRDALNAVGPVDMAVTDIRAAEPGFHARYNAVSREYRYRIQVSPVPPVLERRYVWWRSGALDPQRAMDASERFLGAHRFGTFAGSGRSQSDEADSLIRVVRECGWTRTMQGDVERHEFRAVANGFLPQMVRNMVGAVVRVARGEQSPEWIASLLDANDRRVLGVAAPAHGLVLWRVDYERDVHDDGSAAITVNREHGEE